MQYRRHGMQSIKRNCQFFFLLSFPSYNFSFLFSLPNIFLDLFFPHWQHVTTFLSPHISLFSPLSYFLFLFFLSSFSFLSGFRKSHSWLPITAYPQPDHLYNTDRSSAHLIPSTHSAHASLPSQQLYDPPRYLERKALSRLQLSSAEHSANIYDISEEHSQLPRNVRTSIHEISHGNSQQSSVATSDQCYSKNSATRNNGNGRELVSKEWTEFFDESAEANYWFNNVTGEASWINPFSRKVP